MSKYFFVGSINESKNPRGGAEAKNQFLLKKLQEKFGDKLSYVDMSSSRISIYYRLIIGLLSHKHIILSVASTALEKLAYLNLYLKNKNVSIFIIGGVVDEKFINPRIKALFELASITYAETSALAKSIKIKLPKTKVKHLPNFKELILFDEYNKSNKSEIIKLIYLSRVNVDKGIFRAISLLETLNKNSANKKFELDIYGPIDLSDKDLKTFESKIDQKEVNYLGFLRLEMAEGYTTLSQYHFFIFLTKHPGEGFPGVLIDAMHSKIHIISSDWKYNKEIVPTTGFLVDLGRSNYENDIIAYIDQVLKRDEFNYQIELEISKKESLKYDIKNIEFEIA